MEFRDKPTDAEENSTISGLNAVLNLVRARIEIISNEFDPFYQSLLKRFILVLMVGFFALLTWILVLLAIIVYLVSESSYPLYQIVGIVAGIHFGFLVILLMSLRTSKTPIFPVTRDEFKKDSLWLRTITYPQKSRN